MSQAAYIASGKIVYDPYGRPLRNMRIAVTQKCNLNCFYCHKEGENPSTAEMTPREISIIARVAAELGISRFKITGGEPLMRSDISEIVASIASIEGVRDVSMTTNGTILSSKAEELVEAGLERVNISLDTINPQTYNQITKGNIKPVLESIEAAIQAGLGPIKINTVVLRGLNDSEIMEMVSFAEKAGVILQLIELEPIGMKPETYEKFHDDLKSLEKEFSKMAREVDVRRTMHNRKRYLLPKVEVEVVRSMDNSMFCSACTRMRLTSDGKLKPCLMRKDNLVDILTPIRAGASHQEVRKIFLDAVQKRQPYFSEK